MKNNKYTFTIRHQTMIGQNKMSMTSRTWMRIWQGSSESVEQNKADWRAAHKTSLHWENSKIDRRKDWTSPKTEDSKKRTRKRRKIIFCWFSASVLFWIKIYGTINLLSKDFLLNVECCRRSCGDWTRSSSESWNSLPRLASLESR